MGYAEDDTLWSPTFCHPLGAFFICALGLRGVELMVVKGQKSRSACHATSLIHHIQRGMGLTDVDFTNDAIEHPGRDFVARDPQLCREQRGASIRINHSQKRAKRA